MSETKINIKRTSDNIPSLRDGLNSLMTKIRSNEIIIKHADKGSIIDVVSSEYYWAMCQSHLNNKQYYQCLFENDPSLIVNEKIINYPNKYRSILTDNEYEYLINRNYKISNFYMDPKLHEFKELNEIIENQNSEYINITKNLQIEGRPIVAGPVYYTSEISQMLHLILEPSLSFMPHILKDSFNFLKHLDTTCTEDTLLSSCDIKFLYINIRHDVFYKATDYWIEKLINEIPLLRRFTKAFTLEGLSIILELNYFYINNYFYHKIKGTAMRTIFAVVGSNLTVAYFEEKIFAILPQIYPKDFVHFFIRNYFLFLDDVFHKWLIQFNIQDFYKLMNELDPDLQFIFKEFTKNINFLDINLKIINKKLHFDVYHKPANSFSYFFYKSCHPPHTKNNIALSLAKRIVRIVTDNINNRLQELKSHLLKRKHPEKIIDYSFTKLFRPRKHENNDKNVITFTRTYNPNH